MKKLSNAFKKRKIFFSLILVLTGLSASAIVMSSPEGQIAKFLKKINIFENNKAATPEGACLTLNIPASINIGEKVALGVEKANGFEMMDNSISWTVLYSEAGTGKFLDDSFSSTKISPEFVPIRSGKAKLSVTVVRVGEETKSACGTRLVSQEFSININ
jgi:hypothetical protein